MSKIKSKKSQPSKFFAYVAGSSIAGAIAAGVYLSAIHEYTLEETFKISSAMPYRADPHADTMFMMAKHSTNAKGSDVLLERDVFVAQPELLKDFDYNDCFKAIVKGLPSANIYGGFSTYNLVDAEKVPCPHS
ncbi:MAG: hypothetical protein ACLFR0_05575 [Alphaproteobacteria bacterium]